MTRRRRLSIFAVATMIVVVGLVTAPPSGPPQGSDAAAASPTKRPRATPFPIPTPRYTMPATSRCPGLNDGYRPPTAIVEFQTAKGFAQPPTVEVAPSPLLLPFRPRLPEDLGEGFGVLLGNRAQRVQVVVGYDSAELLRASAEITSIELTLELRDAPPVRLPTTMATGSPTLREFDVAGVPDTDAEGVLHVRITWADSCYHYVAAGPMPVRVASTATVGGCAVGEEAAWAQLAGLFEAPLAFGTSSARIAPSHSNGFLVETPIIDGPYPVAMFDRDSPVATATPGAAIVFFATNPALALRVGERATVLFHAREAVIRHLQAGGAYAGDPIPAAVFESELTLASGRFEIHAPPAPGRYVAGIQLDYAAACFDGAAVAGPGLDVAAG